ncbi:MAG: hypothetical protein J2P19_34225, partial [Pseudonocardia sp.]|nr:hypothetical protein [Pseudonocardia sp.]
MNSGRRRASDVVEEHPRRIEARNSNTDAFVHLDRDRALRSARRVDEAVGHGENAGPLAGVPVAEPRRCLRGPPMGASRASIRRCVAISNLSSPSTNCRKPT